jgi:hypothetical protein
MKWSCFIFLAVFLLGVISIPAASIINQNQEFSMAMKTNPVIAAARQIEMIYDEVYVMSMQLDEKTTGATAWITFNKYRISILTKDERLSHILGAYWDVLKALRETFPDAEYYQIYNSYLITVDTIEGKSHAMQATSVLVMGPTGTDKLIAVGRENFSETVDGLVAQGMGNFKTFVFYRHLLDSNKVMLRPVGFVYSWDK